MSRDWINVRFGLRHWHIGPWYVRTGMNPIWKNEKPWFQVHQFFGLI